MSKRWTSDRSYEVHDDDPPSPLAVAEAQLAAVWALVEGDDFDPQPWVRKSVVRAALRAGSSEAPA